MKTRTAIPITLILFAAGIGAQPALRLKSRVHPAGSPVVRLPAVQGTTHYILQFYTYPDAQLRENLVRRGMKVLEYVPDNALLVSAGGLDLEGLHVAAAEPVDPADKISPLLQGRSSGALLVEFYADATMARARDVVSALGFDIVENGSLLPGQLVVFGPYTRIGAMAQNDDVKYILPAPSDLAAAEAMVGCGGALTEAGAIGDYALAAQPWPKDSAGKVDLKYLIVSLCPKLDQNVARSEIERALREWTRYANMTISPGDRQGAPRSIDIQFARGAHGDPYPFDGPGGVLAHTFYPPPNSEPIAGDMHLDADENWQIGTVMDLYSVALHEAGHALGLGHSDQPGAVMYPYYKLSTGLTSDDIAAIQALYGAAGEVTPPAPAPTPTPIPTPPPTPQPSPTPTAPPPTPAPTPSGPDTAPPTLTVLSPGSTIVSTTSASLVFTGTASDNVGVVAIKWVSSTGDSGTARGTSSWSATVPLLIGTNVITVRAYDAAGNSAWRAVTAVRR